MEQSNAPSTPVRPGFLSVLCILSYIGSGLWALFSLIGIFASGMIMSWFGGAMDKTRDKIETDMDVNMSDSLRAAMTENMDKAEAAVDGVAGMATGMIIGAFVVSLLLACLSLFGVMKMWKLQKSGFWMYTIANVIMLVLFAVGGMWLQAVVAAAFITMYGLNLKHMK